MINASHSENKRLFCLGIYQAAALLCHGSVPMTLSPADHMEKKIRLKLPLLCVDVRGVIWLQTISSLANKKEKRKAAWRKWKWIHCQLQFSLNNVIRRLSFQRPSVPILPAGCVTALENALFLGGSWSLCWFNTLLNGPLAVKNFLTP